MSNLTRERLYQLLPAIYRQRDVALGEPLRALLAVMEQELVAIEQDLGGLYDNWFIETCEEWVVPYLGDLLGVPGLTDELSHLFSQRAHVANAIAYRQRKGVPAMLERVAQDMTGWNAQVVEYFNLLGRTQSVHNVHLKRGQTVNLRNRNAMAYFNSSFDPVASLVEVRRIASRRGKYNIPNVGLFLWRLSSYPMIDGEPYFVDENNGYTFHPLDIDMPLFNRPLAKTEITERTTPRSVPALLTRKMLHDDLETYRQAAVDEKKEKSLYFGTQPVLKILVNGEGIAPEKIKIGDLINWQTSEGQKLYFRASDGEAVEKKFKVIVDPELGRIKFFDAPTGEVRVSYAYGFSANMGGGPYDRRQTLAVPRPESWQAFVSKSGSPNQDTEETHFKSLFEAVEKWNKKKKDGIIHILDNSTYDVSGIKIELSGGRQLVIQAADGKRPCLRGSFTLRANNKKPNNKSKLTLNGLLIGGQLSVLGHLNLKVQHCTVRSGITSSKLSMPSRLNLKGQHDPVRPDIINKGGQEVSQNLQVMISHSLVGPLCLPSEMTELSVKDSIIDGQSEDQAGNAITGAHAQTNEHGPPSTLERVTIFGCVQVKTLTASEAIFTKPVTVQQRQEGYIRFSYVSPGSQTPPRYRCLPNQEHLGFPEFTSTQYGQPGYGQLGQQCPKDITTGAENRAEMGAFEHLLQPQRAANLKTCLDQYLPTGLEAGIFYVT